MQVSRADLAGGQPVNRMIAIPASTQDLFDKLEAVRLVCHRLRATLSGWRRAGRDPADHARLDAELGTTDGERFQAHLEEIYQAAA